MKKPSEGRLLFDRRTVLAGLAAGLSTATWCEAFAQERRGGTLRVSVEFQPISLDPVAGTQGGEFRFLTTMYETLIDWEPATLKPKPGLAKSWSFPDPKTMVLDLQEGVVFHDGTPFDAEAVKFNLERSRTDPRSNFKKDLSAVNTIEVTGPLQVTLHLNRVNAALPLILSERAGLMASPTAITKAPAEFGRAPVGTGPWRVTGWRDNESITLVRHEKYWKPGRPYLDGVVFHIITDPVIGLRSVIAGENDVVNGLSSAQKSVVDRAPQLVSSRSTSQASYPIFLNYSRAPFNDVRVRTAINIAINRDTFNRATMFGLNEVATTLLPKGHWAHDPSLDNFYPYNPGKAKELLAEAGFASGFDMTLIGPTDERSRQRQEVIIEQLRQVGIRVKVMGFSVNDALKTFFVDKQGDGLLIIFGGRPDPTMTFRDLFSKDAYFNPAKWEPEAFAAALADTEASQDFDVRAKAMHKIQRIIAENALIVPLVFDSQFSAYAKKVKGFEPNLFGRPRYEGAWMDQ